MKIEQLIVQHLYKNKIVTLQGIGTIRLNASLAIPLGNEKDFVLPENTFSFAFDLKAPEDPALIDFIVHQTRKIRPLATSDLESYSILAKQFLNIGKPLEIPGVGNIWKNQDGRYEFIQGSYVAPKIEEQSKLVTEKAEEPVSFEHESSGRQKLNLPAISLALIMLALAGAALYYFLFYNKSSVPEHAADSVAQIPKQTDSLKKDTTVQAKKDSSFTPAPLVPKPDSAGFKVVIKEYQSEIAANKALERLSKYNNNMLLIKKDSAHYQVALPFKRPLTDTAKMRDSLRIYFGGKPFVLLH